uniref:Cuticlin N-terminal domain-containing protein n=1 Tax=Romanomermis culicivorax TaxID=13658 RepID=A0A915JUU6_ROMCU
DSIFLRIGPRGAEIVCNSDHLEINILTKRPFNGHLYIKNHFGERNCSTRAPMKKNGQYGNHVSLKNIY